MRPPATQLPESPVVMAMRGAGDPLRPQLMAEIGAVTRAAHRDSITAFAGADPGADQFGTYEAESNRASRGGLPELGKYSFSVMGCLLKTMPEGDPLYRFADRKRAEGRSLRLLPVPILALTSPELMRPRATVHPWADCRNCENPRHGPSAEIHA